MENEWGWLDETPDYDGEIARAAYAEGVCLGVAYTSAAALFVLLLLYHWESLEWVWFLP
jgi:hypothetical protein